MRTLVDMSDVYDDPDLTSRFLVVRNFNQVGADGESANVTQQFWARGVVTAPSADTMQQFPDLATTKGAIEITTGTQLYGVTTTTLADQIEWEGSTYIVQGPVGNLLRMGGFMHVIATLDQNNPTGPVAPRFPPAPAVSS